MRLKPTSREKIFDRFMTRQHLFRYFYFEEDAARECDQEMFGYSKFVDDECYNDDEVNWMYILNKNNSILGICAIKEDEDDDICWLKFLEVRQDGRSRGIGSCFIECLKNYTSKKAIMIYPKDDVVAKSFYAPNGFVWDSRLKNSMILYI